MSFLHINVIGALSIIGIAKLNKLLNGILVTKDIVANRYNQAF